MTAPAFHTFPRRVPTRNSLFIRQDFAVGYVGGDRGRGIVADFQYEAVHNHGGPSFDDRDYVFIDSESGKMKAEMRDPKGWTSIALPSDIKRLNGAREALRRALRKANR